MEKAWKLILFGVVLAAVAYGSFIFGMSYRTVDIIDLEKAAQFGDSFGALTSLFSGLAFAGLIITILMQREELKIQRTEFQMTRNEMAESSDALQKQVNEMKKSSRVNAVSALAQVHLGIVRQSGTNRAGEKAQEELRICIRKLELMQKS